MGCAASAPIEDTEARDRNSAIERQLKEDEKASRNEIKMLLLGAGESGKSTIVKQMRLVYQGSYSDHERVPFKEIIFSNTVQSLRVLVEGVAALAIPIDSSCQPYAQAIMAAPSQLEVDTLPQVYIEAVKHLWADKGIKAAYERRSELQLNDSAGYFFDQIDSIGSNNYIPSDQDILRSRVKSTGISEARFKIDATTYLLFDVGGQRSERKKWIHCFEDVQALVFCVATSEYDQKLYEDEEVARVDESLQLFDSIVNSRWFISSTIILFLNKSDLFRQKVLIHPLEDYFDYKGHSIQEAEEFMAQMFLRLNKKPSKRIYHHHTSAVSTKQMKFVISAVHDTLITRTLQDANFI